MGIDNLYFYPDRCFGSAENTTNQAIYDLREAEYTDENLLTSEECEKRANSLLLQLQDKTIAVTFTVAGNTNVKRGDRLTLTLPPDNITNMLFDVVSVKHVYHKTGGFTSMPQLVYNVDTRVFPTQSPTEALLRGLQNVRNVTSELYSRVVR